MLTAIIGSAEMMERYVNDNTAQAKLLKSIQEAAGRAAELTGQLLQASTDMAQVVKSVRESGRRMEIATYVIVGLTIVQLFYIAFQFSAKH